MDSTSANIMNIMGTNQLHDENKNQESFTFLLKCIFYKLLGRNFIYKTLIILIRQLNGNVLRNLAVEGVELCIYGHNKMSVNWEIRYSKRVKSIFANLPMGI